MKYLTLLAGLIGAGSLISPCVFAQSSTLQIDHVWSRAAIVGHEGVVYLTITNSGQADVLTGAVTPVADMAELHQSINDHGVMKMRAVTALPIDTGKSVNLAPNGYHIMLMHLKQPLIGGDSFPILLRFAKAGDVKVTATVGNPTAAR